MNELEELKQNLLSIAAEMALGINCVSAYREDIPTGLGLEDALNKQKSQIIEWSCCIRKAVEDILMVERIRVQNVIDMIESDDGEAHDAPRKCKYCDGVSLRKYNYCRECKWPWTETKQKYGD